MFRTLQKNAPVARLLSDTPIPNLNSLSLEDFWSWAYSDLLANTIRPIYAEFLVNAALGNIGTPREEWADVDVTYETGGKTLAVEVKSAGYLQSWSQKDYSKIVFDIGKKQGWNPKTGISNNTPVRTADCYVFCVYEERLDKTPELVLDVNRWSFYIVNTADINQTFEDQKQVSLKLIQKLCPEPVRYVNLREQINTVAGAVD